MNPFDLEHYDVVRAFVSLIRDLKIMRKREIHTQVIFGKYYVLVLEPREEDSDGE